MGIYGFKKIVKPSSEVIELKRIIDKWREPALVFVKASSVVPDTSNRGHTGLSVDHCHLLATLMLKDGFRPREIGVSGKGQQGHDIPVLVRGSTASPISAESLEYWRSVTNEELSFPEVVIGDSEEWFTSLGNGHFMQALNLFYQRTANVFTNEHFVPDPADTALATVLNCGVQSIVLSAEMPVDERRRLSLLLNRTHDYKWGVDTSGAVDVRPEACEARRYTLFEAESRFVDTGTLGLRVRLELGLKTSDRSNIPNGDDGTPWPKSKQLEHLNLDKKQSKL